MAVTTLHLVRHGESEWNVARRLQGQSDAPTLTARGRRQAQAAARSLGGDTVAAVYSSDLRRAVETAEPIAAAHGLTVRTTTGLREQGYGVLEGRPSELALADPGYDLLDPDGAASGGESLRDVHDRVGPTLASIIADHDGQTVVLVSHGDTIRAAAAWLDGLGADAVPWRDVPNGSITTFAVEG